jgi:hypothetical protein
MTIGLSNVQHTDYVHNNKQTNCFKHKLKFSSMKFTYINAASCKNQSSSFSDQGPKNYNYTPAFPRGHATDLWALHHSKIF